MIEVYVLEFDKEKIEFTTEELAIKYANENNINVKPFKFEKEIILPNKYNI